MRKFIIFIFFQSFFYIINNIEQEERFENKLSLILRKILLKQPKIINVIQTHLLFKNGKKFDDVIQFNFINVKSL